MNSKDRQRLMRLKGMMGRVPLPNMGGGAKTPTVVGFVEFADDMRGALWAWQEVVNGMMLELSPEHHEEWGDYHDPDFVLDVFDEWLAMRNEQNWHNAANNTFPDFFIPRKKERATALEAAVKEQS